MKRIILMAAAAILAAATVSAQDLEQATNTYNNGVMALQMGDNTTALDSFKQALTMAEACGESGNDVAANCKNVIPGVMLSIAKDFIQNKEYDKAVTSLKEAATVAKEYGNADTETEAIELVPQVLLQKANDLLKEKDFANAVNAYNEAIAADPDNGRAYLLLGSALASSGKIAEAEAAYTKAGELGESSDATKQLANLYLRVANSYYKAKKYTEAIEAAEKSISYVDSNANTYLIAANSAQKLNDNAAAISYFEKYISMPKARNVNAYTFTIAVLYQQAGNKEKAIEYYQKVASDQQYGTQAQEQLKALQQ
ncbi:MAG: tetratricopeptide repeat protein [Bacteroidetes bacterium]|uniref:Tetratricopeptide repeat protein n=1 Tax=Candidatus Cryptobacteroides intestinavium TaxID=2840766 RepID=A0A9D9HET3_9BACT|nr:tetratricopeptide repeat protein [Candidatus Cryptobacteroides intestinavium]